MFSLKFLMSPIPTPFDGCENSLWSFWWMPMHSMLPDYCTHMRLIFTWRISWTDKSVDSGMPKSCICVKRDHNILDCSIRQRHFWSFFLGTMGRHADRVGGSTRYFVQHGGRLNRMKELFASFRNAFRIKSLIRTNPNFWNRRGLASILTWYFFSRPLFLEHI